MADPLKTTNKLKILFVVYSVILSGCMFFAGAHFEDLTPTENAVTPTEIGHDEIRLLNHYQELMRSFFNDPDMAILDDMEDVYTRLWIIEKISPGAGIKLFPIHELLRRMGHDEQNGEA